MKHTKRMKFLANMTTASTNPLVNPIPTLTALKDILTTMKDLQARTAAPGHWTLIGPDGRAWTGPSPQTLAAQATWTPV